GASGETAEGMSAPAGQHRSQCQSPEDFRGVGGAKPGAVGGGGDPRSAGRANVPLSAPAFFQLNPEQTVKLYDEVKRAASLTGREIVVDAYCGVGAIGLWLAPEARRVIGMDTVPEAVRNARENARRNGIHNAEYHVGRAEEW